jgi:hypothetical protein
MAKNAFFLAVNLHSQSAFLPAVRIFFKHCGSLVPAEILVFTVLPKKRLLPSLSH